MFQLNNNLSVLLNICIGQKLNKKKINNYTLIAFMFFFIFLLKSEKSK